MSFNVGADAFPAINDVMRCAPDAEPPAQEFLARAGAYFAKHERGGFSIRARAHVDGDLIELCKARGMYLIGASPGMLIREPIPELPVPESARGIELRVADTPAAMRDFSRVCAASYATIGMPVLTAEKVFALPERMLAKHLHVVVAYDGNEPVSAALALLSHGIGGLYWVGTAPAARKRGIAPLVTRAVTNWCFSQGVRSVVLQASKQGEPIYRALGYQEITRYPWFLCTLQQALSV
jgi:ribosomal protein S18 acetylase RimI-like enzyme